MRTLMVTMKMVTMKIVTLKIGTMDREYEARIKVATMMPLTVTHLLFVVEAGKDFFGMLMISSKFCATKKSLFCLFVWNTSHREGRGGGEGG